MKEIITSVIIKSGKCTDSLHMRKRGSFSFTLSPLNLPVSYRLTTPWSCISFHNGFCFYET